MSGTTAAGVAGAVVELSGSELAAIPYSGPWTAGTLGGLFDVVAALERPVTLVGNLLTGHLWGGHPTPDQLLDYLFDGALAGPPPDWDVGHFACVVGSRSGARRAACMAWPTPTPRSATGASTCSRRSAWPRRSSGASSPPVG